MNDFLCPALAALLLSGCSGIAFAHEAPQTPLDVARILEARIAAGEGTTLPDAQPDVVHDAGAGAANSLIAACEGADRGDNIVLLSQDCQELCLSQMS